MMFPIADLPMRIKEIRLLQQTNKTWLFYVLANEPEAIDLLALRIPVDLASDRLFSGCANKGISIKTRQVVSPKEDLDEQNDSWNTQIAGSG